MQFIGVALGFAILIIFTYKDWSVYLASFLAAVAVILLYGLPVTQSLTSVYFAGIGSICTSLLPLFIFSSVMAKMYAVSGAAISISNTICSTFISEESSEHKRQIMGILVVILSSALICLGGVNAAIVIITIYPIAMSIFERCNIPKRFAPGVILGGCVTFALTSPGSPQPPNIIPMQILNTASVSGLLPGVIAAGVEIIVMVIILNHMITKAKQRGEVFAWGKKDTGFQLEGKHPGFFLSLIPLVSLFILFNLYKVHILYATLFAAVLSGILFYPYIEKGKIKGHINAGFQSALAPVGSIGAVYGFAAVIQKTDAFQTIVDGIVKFEVHPILLCIYAIAFMCMLTGGSSTGQQIILPIVGPIVGAQGLGASMIHRISAFASTTIDSLPHSGTILMTLNHCDCKMKDAYPAIFFTTTFATTCGTIVVAALLYFFPWLA